MVTVCRQTVWGLMQIDTKHIVAVCLQGSLTYEWHTAWEGKKGVQAALAMCLFLVLYLVGCNHVKQLPACA